MSRPRFDLGRRSEDVLVVSVHGDLDLGSADDLRTALEVTRWRNEIRLTHSPSVAVAPRVHACSTPVAFTASTTRRASRSLSISAAMAPAQRATS